MDYLTKKNKQTIEKMVSCIGYLPAERVFYIDKEVNFIIKIFRSTHD